MWGTAGLVAAAVVISVISMTNAFAQQSNCKSIQDPKARLECFDALATPQPKSTADPRTKGYSLLKEKMNNTVVQDGWQVTTEQGWQLHRRNDPMTNKIECYLAPVGKPYAQFTTHNFLVSYKERGGVKGYTYRLDDGAVTEMQLPTEEEQELDILDFSDGAFNSILGASRLRLEVLTVLDEIVDDDFPLSGMRGLFVKMKQECAD